MKEGAQAVTSLFKAESLARQRAVIIPQTLLSQTCILKATAGSMFLLCSLVIILGKCLLICAQEKVRGVLDKFTEDIMPV